MTTLEGQSKVIITCIEQDKSITFRQQGPLHDTVGVVRLEIQTALTAGFEGCNYNNCQR